MDFRIRSIVLWPKNDSLDLRIINFEINKVNVITGGSEKGKSALIGIIDYCLGSGICKVPRNKIRETVGWYGVLFAFNQDSEILICRKNPDFNDVSNEFYIKSDSQVQLPKEIISNYNIADLKTFLNSLANLSDNKYLTESEGFNNYPSFRDLTSFLFQPQYIVANQSTLFYRSDQLEKRLKLRNIFKYILKAVDSDYLEKEDQLKTIEKSLLNYKREYDRRNSYTQKWLGQLKGYFLQAKEFGLLQNIDPIDSKWSHSEYLDALREINLEVSENIIPKINTRDVIRINNRIAELTSQEIEVASKLNIAKHRQEIINKIIKSNIDLMSNILSQHNRLLPFNWLDKLLSNSSKECPFCGNKDSDINEYVNNLINTKNNLVNKGQKLRDNDLILKSELNKLNTEIGNYTDIINNIRAELNEIKKSDPDDSAQLNTLNSVYIFAGKISAEINQFDVLFDEADLLIKINELQEKRENLVAELNDKFIKTKIDFAKSFITERIKHFANIFEAENRLDKIEFDEVNLTLNFISKNGTVDSLYSIGSGHNYMSYHIATLLALHEYFLHTSPHPVPNFIIFDQPSQVYYPEKSDEESLKKDDDLIRVKRIFEVLQDSINRTKGLLQIIILEHVGDHAWSKHRDIVRVKRWRPDEEDNALIPITWL